MDVGIKIWSRDGYKKINELASVADFIELLPNKKEHIPKLKDTIKLILSQE